MKAVSALRQLGVRPSDIPELKQNKIAINDVNLALLGAGLMWGGIYYLLGFTTPSLVPFIFCMVLPVAFAIHAFTGAYRLFANLTAGLILVAPFAFQLLIGGFEKSGGVLLWAVFAPLGSMVFLSLRSAWAWLVLFIVEIAAVAYLEPTIAAATPPVDAPVRNIAFAGTVGFVSVMVFLTVRAFILRNTRQKEEIMAQSEQLNIANAELNLRQEELNQNLEEMQAQQEELVRTQGALRANARKLEELNENLELRVAERTQELESALTNLKASQSKLVESEKFATLGTLVAGVAHEINTPVGIAVTAASHLQSATQDFSKSIAEGTLKKSLLARYVENANESSDIILKNLERAAELVQSFKRVAVNQSNEAVQPFNLRRYVEQIMLSLRPKIKQTKIEPVIEIPEDIEMNSLPSALSQVVINFVTNSLRYAYEPEDTGRMHLWAHQQNGTVTFKFSDDGKGIPPENLPQIFNPFFTTGRAKGGSGLGLNIVYNLITQKLFGQVDVESELGKGTTFTLKLPTDISPLSV